MNWEPVIGLEVHVELNTKTKMFCRCSADYFGQAPNTHTCPVCLGLPGALPYINKEAIQKCIKIGLALHCTVNPESFFERKNYFYPDLPKGYQISQYVLPLSVNGWMDVEDAQGNITRVRINRVHQEEDTGKLTHADGETLIDFNRSSVPLVEIVTEPDFTDPTQVRDYAKKLQQIFRYLGVSNADMERGDMRLEANVSVRPVGPASAKAMVGKQKELPNYRVELKNINSFRFMVAAVEYEIKRQIEAHENGEQLHQETRGWDEDRKRTYVQRSKEEAHDYRYFPDPDLPKIEMSDEIIEKLKQEMPELPEEKVTRYMQSFNLLRQHALILAESKEESIFFEQAVAEGESKGIDPKMIANYLINQKVDISSATPQQVISSITSKKSDLVEDDAELEKYAKEAIEENPEVVEKYKSGKTNVIQALVGAVMKKTRGKAHPEKTHELLEKLLR